VRGFDEDGFYVALADDAVAEEVEQLQSGRRAGKMDLMWRCWQCGEVGRIAEIPDGCPSCGAPREDIYYWTED
jgi:rubrerythrin